ncbi:Uncharacterised protein [Serratia fonticola]|nr:Uncharacterised protein [Serratia fonticola]CAI1704738.1 Uncharacterised protein [Serratia fonticola]CAI1890411.1 Uncharacterised protein [Serratia fonticola]
MRESGLRIISQYANQVALRAAFFVPEIQTPQGSPRFFVSLAESNTLPCIGIAHQRYYGTLTFTVNLSGPPEAFQAAHAKPQGFLF